MRVLFRVLLSLFAVSLAIATTSASAQNRQDRNEFRDRARELAEELRGYGEPMDRCAIGVFVAGNAIVSRRIDPSSPLAPGDQLLSVNGVDVSNTYYEDVIALLREIGDAAMVPMVIEREGEELQLDVACSNSRDFNEALLSALDNAGRRRFDECVDVLRARNDLGAEGAALEYQCATFSSDSDEYDLSGMLYESLRMAIEDARWVVENRSELITQLRLSEQWLIDSLGSSRFTELVDASREWPGGEDLYDASEPDWSVFRSRSEAALLARLIDPDSASIEWPYGFIYGSWRPNLFASPVQGYWTCGLVNARNRMGGFTGRKYFVVVFSYSESLQYIEIEGTSDYDSVALGCSNSLGALPPPQSGLVEPGPAESTPNLSIADELQKLVDLRDSGALTEEEFQAAKDRLLGTSPQL